LVDESKKTTFPRVSGNRQGDNRAPIRFNLSTGVITWFLHEQVTRDSLTIRTLLGTEGTPHTPTDLLEVKVTTAEMVDDSLHFSLSLETTVKHKKIHEEFQYTYGSKTAYGPNKTVLAILNNPDTNPESVTHHRVKEGGMLVGLLEGDVEWEEVEVPVTDNLTFENRRSESDGQRTSSGNRIICDPDVQKEDTSGGDTQNF
jgi:hypothetical protein